MNLPPTTLGRLAKMNLREVWRIGDSLPAPKFNIVSKPNDWSREVMGSADRLLRQDLTPAKQLQIEFWTAFRAFVEEGEHRFRPTKPGPQSLAGVPRVAR